MKKSIKVTKVIAVMSLMVFVWVAASWMDIIAHNTKEPVIVYVNKEFVTVSPYADWNLFNLSLKGGEING